MLMIRPDSLRAQVVGEHLHVAGEDDEFDAFALHGLQQPRLGVGLGVAGDRDVLEGHAVGPGQLAEVGVVGDHGGDLDRQRAGAGAEQQVVEAVAEPADHEDDPHPLLGGVDLPVHAVRVAHRGEAGPQLVGGHLGLGGEVHPHEEQPGVLVAELLAVHDVAAGHEEVAGDRVHDALLVGARQREDVLRAAAAVRSRRQPRTPPAACAAVSSRRNARRPRGPPRGRKALSGALEGRTGRAAVAPGPPEDGRGPLAGRHRPVVDRQHLQRPRRRVGVLPVRRGHPHVRLARGPTASGQPGWSR